MSGFESGKTLFSIKEREGLDAKFTSFHLPPFGLRPEAVILDRAVFASLSRGQSNPLRGFSSSFILLKQKKRSLAASLFCFKEREGLDCSVTFSSLTFSLNTRAFSLTPRRERWDKTFTSFQFHSPSLKEREGWDGSVTFCSFAALRVTADGRNP